MSERCNRVGVRIYPDVVFNHMSSIEGVGTAGSTFSAKDLNYPGVPFAREHFNPHCPMSTWDDVAVVRNCWLEGELGKVLWILENLRTFSILF